VQQKRLFIGIFLVYEMEFSEFSEKNENKFGKFETRQ
jgi:hypothetical protein